MPEVEEQTTAQEQDIYGISEDDITEEPVEETDDAEVEETEDTPEPSETETLRAQFEQANANNRHLQQKIVQLMEAQQAALAPKQVEPDSDFAQVLAEIGFDEPTSAKLAVALERFAESKLSKKFAKSDELQRMTGTLAHLARNADEARVFEEFRQQGVPDNDIKAARKLVDDMVNNENAYFPNAQVAMDAALGRLSRQRATKTATETSAARVQKTAGRKTADMGHNRGGAGVPTLTDEEKAAAADMDTAEFLDWIEKKTGQSK